MSVNKEVTSIEYSFHQDDDRWIYIERNENRKIVGLNFMQGDELELFKSSYASSDPALTEFYQSMLYTFPIEKASCSEYSFINKCMWAFFTAKTSGI